MIARNSALTVTILVVILALATACGGQPRANPVEEVTTRMTAEDQAALDDRDNRSQPATDPAAEPSQAVERPAP